MLGQPIELLVPERFRADRILLKLGPLDPEEWTVMRMHPVYARQMVVPAKFLRTALDISYCHHEKRDSTGYPTSLKG